MFRFTEAKAKFIFIFIPVIFIISGLIGVCINLSLLSTKDMNIIVGKILGEYTEQDVTIEKIDIFWWDRIVIRNIEIKNPQNNKIILKVEDIILNFSLKSLLKKDYNSSVQNIILNNPELNVIINPDNTSNLDFIKDLIKKSKTDKNVEYFKSTININKGKISLENHRNELKKYVLEFDSRINLQEENILNINTRLESDGLKRTFVIFRYNMLNGNFACDLKTDGIDFAYLPENIIHPKYKPISLKGKVKGYLGVESNFSDLYKYKKIAFQLRFSKLGVKYDKLDLKNTDIYLECKNNYIRYSGLINLNGFEFNSKGDGFLNKRDVSSSNINLRVGTKNADLSKIAGLIKDKNILPKDLSGKMSAEIDIKGTVKDPSILVHMTLNKTILNSNEINKALLSFEFENEKLKFKAKASSKNISNFYIQGFLDNINPKSFDLKKININSQGYVKIPNISVFFPEKTANVYLPKSSFESIFQIGGTGHNPKVVANAKVYDGFFRFNKKEISNINISSLVKFSKNEGLLVEKAIISNFLDTDIIASANVKNLNQVKFNVSIINLDIKKLIDTFNIKNSPDISAYGSFVATVKLVEKDTYIYGDAEIYEIQYENYEIDFMKCIFAMKNDNVEFKNFSILASPAALTYSGYANNIFSKNIEFKGDIKVSNVDIETIANRLGKSNKEKSENGLLLTLNTEKNIPDMELKNPLNESSNNDKDKNLSSENIPVSGTFDGNFSISGKIDLKDPENINFDDLYGAGKLEMTDFIIDKYPFDYASADFSLADDMIYLDNLSGRASNLGFQREERETTISGLGALNVKTQEIQGIINFDNVNISDFQDYLKDYGYLSGSCNIKCELEGTLEKINATFNGNMRRFNINGKSYRNANFLAYLYNSNNIDFDMQMSRDAQYYNFSLKNYNMQENRVEDMKFSTVNISAVDLLELFTMSPIGAKESVRNALNKFPLLTGGVLNFNLELSGYLDTLSGNGEINGGNIFFGSEVVNDIDVKIDVKEGVINIPEMMINFPEMVISADAFPLFDKNNQTNMNISAINVPLGRLAGYTNINGIGGTLAFDALIKGDIKSPNITLSADIQEPSFKNIKLSRITASKITIDNKKIDLQNGIYLILEDHFAEIKGTIPWDNLKYKIDEDSPIELAFAMDNQDMVFVSQLFPNIIKNNTKGVFDSHITFNGTAKDPIIDGYAKISKGEIYSVGETLINNLDAYITFSNLENNKGFKININSLMASDNKSKNKSFEIKEGSYIDIYKDGQAFVSVDLKLDNYYFIAKNFTEMQEDISCIVNGNISIKGDSKNPLITDNNMPIKLTNLKYAFDIPPAKEQMDNENVSYRNNNVNIKGKKDLFINPTFDLKVETKGAEIIPPLTRLKVNADASLSGRMDNPYFDLEAIATEGRVLLQVARLRINKGSSFKLSYIDNNRISDMNISGYTDVRTTNKLGISNVYRVTASLTGGFEDYKMTVVSDPEGLNDQQILSAIGRFGVVQNENGEDSYKINIQDTLANVGISTIMSPIEDFFIETLGIDTLTLDYKTNEYALINMEKNFGRRFFASFYTNLYYRPELYQKTNISGWGLSVGTRLWKWYKVTLGIDEQNPIRADVSLTFAF